ncbi:unknown [Ruminococcus sp. CAG:330]|nr:unknown [Ruminococcus sp. CAG:330]
MNENHKLYIWINIKSFFKCNRIHIPCITFCINENSLAVLI